MHKLTWRGIFQCRKYKWVYFKTKFGVILVVDYGYEAPKDNE